MDKTLTLFDMTEKIIDNEFCIVLKVKDGHELDLIALGIFDGDETMFRFTRDTKACTIFRKNSKPYTLEWADGARTIQSQKEMLRNCIVRDYGIDFQFR